MAATRNDIQWESSGTTVYGAAGARDVLIIVSDAPLSNPDVVPRRESVELTEEQRKGLENQGVPRNSQQDDLSVMKARFGKDKACSLIAVESGKRDYILKRISVLMRATTKEGVLLFYIGPGKRNTGDWCFEDGYITFRDLAQLYVDHFKGRVLTIATDCSFSGSWVKELMKFLGEQGVRPCGHSAREKGILIKVYTSCGATEIPAKLHFSFQGVQNDKNSGRMSYITKEFSETQHAGGIDATATRCSVQAITEKCTLSPNSTWQKWSASKRVHLVSGKDRGRPCWHYVLLVDDDETIKQFKLKVKSGNVDVADYGEVLKSGWGEEPPNEVRDWVDKNYKTEYT